MQIVFHTMLRDKLIYIDKIIYIIKIILLSLIITGCQIFNYSNLSKEKILDKKYMNEISEFPLTQEETLYQDKVDIKLSIKITNISLSDIYIEPIYYPFDLYYHSKLIKKNISLPSFEAGFEPKPILLHPQQSHEYTFYLNKIYDLGDSNASYEILISRDYENPINSETIKNSKKVNIRFKLTDGKLKEKSISTESNK